MTLISTVYFNQVEILNAISKLYLDSKPFELDPCYGQGNFYRRFPEPKWKFDINPRVPGVKKADCRDLSQFSDNSVESIIFDPPFLCGGGNNGIMHKKYGSFKNPAEMEKMYSDSLLELHRILTNKGILVFKCMDFIYGRKNYFNHILINNLAAVTGFTAEDLFILVSKNRVMQWNLHTQQHARKFHSFFWVFRK